MFSDEMISVPQVEQVLSVKIRLVSGFEKTYEAEDIIENEDWVQIVTEIGSISFPMHRIDYWEVSEA